MNVMRVTQFHSADAAIDRSLFQLLEYFSSFCLIECKRQSVIQIPRNARFWFWTTWTWQETRKAYCVA